MKIIDYRFGRLSTESQTFSKDLILTSDKIYPNWWRSEGHKLHWADITYVLEEIEPEVMIIGQGKFGMMVILPEVKLELMKRGIELIAEKTSKAVKKFNDNVDKKKTVGAFHLTC